MQQSCLINGDIKNNIRGHAHGVVMATRIPNYPVGVTYIALLICAFGNDGRIGGGGGSIFFHFSSQLTKYVDITAPSAEL